MSVKITFLGAAGTVTGSKYLVEGAGKKLLVDCGLFQGDRSWNEKNWIDPDFSLKSVDALLLTHAHIDHVGILPRYHRLGLTRPVFCTKATKALSELILMDSARLQEEEAEYREQRGKSRHHPALPLYTSADAESVLKQFRTVPCEKRIEVVPGVYAEWRRMGHIIGACSIRLEIGGKIINFSGDIGRYHVPVLKDPQPVSFGDLLLVESTYGDREHPSVDPELELAKVINETYARRGIVLIPSFAVGRTQLLLYYIRELKAKKLIPDLPIVVDSPMALDATSIYRENPDDYDESALGILRQGKEPFSCSQLAFVRHRGESIKLNSVDSPMVLISASGMLTGGRILHHLRHRVSDPRNTILFVGFQPPGSRGAWIKSKPETVRVFGQELPMRAQVEEISSLSAHGDRSELLRWCRECSGRPGKVAVVHGEQATADAFRSTLQSEFGWDAFVPSYLQSIEF
ncbi:MAG: MBL fold metallo-hydrolase [Deltaproteobacteria bacterium]|nr:MBL fold metallo-hydrolase [Deltaproteobacteria bacterium]